MAKDGRDPLAIIREIKTIRSEKMLTPAYKAARIQALEQELSAAQSQFELNLPPAAPAPAPPGRPAK